MARTPSTLLLSAVLALAPLAPAAGAEPSPEEASPEAAVADLIREQVEAWNSGDLEGFCAAYAEDATFISPSGLTQGRAAVLARYRSRYPDRTAMGTLAIEIVETRVAAGEGAAAPGVSVGGRWSLSYPDREAAAGLTLIVFHRREGGGWEIVQDASM